MLRCYNLLQRCNFMWNKFFCVEFIIGKTLESYLITHHHFCSTFCQAELHAFSRVPPRDLMTTDLIIPCLISWMSLLGLVERLRNCAQVCVSDAGFVIQIESYWERHLGGLFGPRQGPPTQLDNHALGNWDAPVSHNSVQGIESHIPGRYRGPTSCQNIK
jgi:hypothetical protein